MYLIQGGQRCGRVISTAHLISYRQLIRFKRFVAGEGGRERAGREEGRGRKEVKKEGKNHHVKDKQSICRQAGH